MMFIGGIGKMAVSNIVVICSLQRVECRKAGDITRVDEQ
jgi:hypothetical protein